MVGQPWQGDKNTAHCVTQIQAHWVRATPAILIGKTDLPSAGPPIRVIPMQCTEIANGRELPRQLWHVQKQHYDERKSCPHFEYSSRVTLPVWHGKSSSPFHGLDSPFFAVGRCVHGATVLCAALSLHFGADRKWETAYRRAHNARHPLQFAQKHGYSRSFSGQLTAGSSERTLPTYAYTYITRLPTLAYHRR